MTFKYVKYDVLKADLLEGAFQFAAAYGYRGRAFNEFIEAYRENKANAKELAKRYKDISSKRRTQLGILLTVLQCLEQSNESLEKKDELLNAVAYYIFECIIGSYNTNKSWLNYFASYITDPRNSELHGVLFNCLGINQNNQASYKELHDMYVALELFIMSCTYKNPENILQGFFPVHPFLSEKIEDFDVSEFLKILGHRIKELDDKLREQSKFATSVAQLTQQGMYTSVVIESSIIEAPSTQAAWIPA